MSDLFGNHIVGFPTRRLILMIMFLFSGYSTVPKQTDRLDVLNGVRCEFQELKANSCGDKTDLFK